MKQEIEASARHIFMESEYCHPLCCISSPSHLICAAARYLPYVACVAWTPKHWSKILSLIDVSLPLMKNLEKLTLRFLCNNTMVASFWESLARQSRLETLQLVPHVYGCEKLSPAMHNAIVRTFVLLVYCIYDDRLYYVFGEILDETHFVSAVLKWTSKGQTKSKKVNLAFCMMQKLLFVHKTYNGLSNRSRHTHS